jgi:hypothetical protein
LAARVYLWGRQFGRSAFLWWAPRLYIRVSGVKAPPPPGRLDSYHDAVELARRGIGLFAQSALKEIT